MVLFKKNNNAIFSFFYRYISNYYQKKIVICTIYNIIMRQRSHILVSHVITLKCKLKKQKVFLDAIHCACSTIRNFRRLQIGNYLTIVPQFVVSYFFVKIYFTRINMDKYLSQWAVWRKRKTVWENIIFHRVTLLFFLQLKKNNSIMSTASK